ncbi:MAG TPA: IS630 family transposase [Geminicoccaceae bacterium]|nr:IS630 family transposase [Geminicoccaceae bacterium]
MPALAIRQDLPAAALRRRARREPDRRAAMRLLAIAHALDGFSRAEAARLAGMERQALRDAVIRYNAEGPDGLHDRPRSGRPEGLTPGQQAALKAWVLRGPDPERDKVSAWRLVDICAHAERAYGVRYSAWGMSRLLRRLGLSWQKARPRHPQGSAAERAAFKKELGSKLAAIAGAHPDKRLQLWCADEARMGQKGRTCHRWYERGVRPPGPADRRFESLYLFAACRPGTDQAFALALPEATTKTMDLFLDGFARQLEPGIHAALILDRAGWHGGRSLAVPENITLLLLPPYSPELNPVERVWLYLRERFLSLQVFKDYPAIVDACCVAWNRLTAEPGRLRSLCGQPWIQKVSS